MIPKIVETLMDAPLIQKSKEALLNLLFKKSFRYSPEPIFILTSGKKSSYYMDCKKTTLDPEGMFLIGEILFDRIKNLSIKGVGGLTLGADPIAMAISSSSFHHQHPIPAFVIRKEPKKHGAQRWIEGDIPKGERVIVVEDVVTTGGSTRKAIEILLQEGYEIDSVHALVDREEGGKENISQLGYFLNSLFTLKDFMKIQSR